MANVFDVAEYVLAQKGPMSAMKLQKLVYYAQAWHVVWLERALFESPIEAWANGPVVPELYQKHKGVFLLERGFFGGDPSKFVDDEKEAVDKVLSFYGDKNPQWLSNLTHLEDPWIHARDGLAEGQSGNQEITLASMMEYYGGL